MLRTDIYGLPPGLTAAAETYEAAFRWGQFGLGVITGVIIDSGTIDSGNTPTFELRPGLVLGQKIATGTYINYNPNNSDGSEVATAVLMMALRIQDFQGNNQQRFMGALVGGPVKGGMLLGLDLQARQQMSANFQFDDGLAGNHWYPWKREISKSANYTILSTDNFTLFDNTGATGSITITLPPIANGYEFGFKCFTANTIVVTSNEGSNIWMDNNTTASTATLAARIGTGARVYSNPAGTKWIVDYMGAQGGANETIT